MVERIQYYIILNLTEDIIQEVTFIVITSFHMVLPIRELFPN